MGLSAFSLEDECYKKYGKAGKSFYYSQVASTVRWLSTTNATDLINRLGARDASPSTNISSESEHPITSPPLPDHCGKEAANNELFGNATSDTSCSRPVDRASFDIKLPPIPSFSEFVNKRKGESNQVNSSQKHLRDMIIEKAEKRKRLQ